MFKIKIQLIIFIGCFLSAACAPAPSPQTTAAPSSFFLRVQGREILDSQGYPLTLRGFNFHTYYYSYLCDPAAPPTYATRQDIQFIKSLGANAIRLGFHWRYFETSLGFDLLGEYLNWCEQEGVYVILDMHVVPPARDIRKSVPNAVVTRALELSRNRPASADVNAAICS